jgi:N-acetylglucosaminyldiphosphoundecaprenol N-acetyl-beta-D-mannosaminyltransferase
LLWDHQGGNVAVAIHYLQWLRLAYVKAMELHWRIGIDVIHHISYGTISAPPPFWKLPVPFVWGPVGGAQSVPPAFRHYISFLSGGEILRNVRLASLPLSPSLRRAARSSAVILATNHETYAVLAKAGARNVRLFLDSGVPSSFVSSPRVRGLKGRPFTLLWAGRMQPRKALPLGLEALAKSRDVGAKLLVVGEGKMRREWESYAKHLNLGDRVHFLGEVAWNEMSRLYQTADAFLFTSLRDSFGTQVLEAMAHGLPILALDHQGVAAFVPPDGGIKVPVTTPRQTTARLAEGIRGLALRPEERLKMGEAARAYAKTQTWDRRAERMSEIYKEAVQKCLIPKTLQSHTRKNSKIQGGKGALQTPPSKIVQDHACFQVLEVRVNALQIPDVVAQMEEWIRNPSGCHSIAATSMHGIVEAQHAPAFKEILNSTDLVVPDGMPLVWLGRRRGHDLPRRVYGPDLMATFFEKTAGKGYRHFLYGGKPGVAEQLAETLQCRFPETQVAGTYSPPFRPLTQEEDDEIAALISRTAPDVVWVGLGAPKQERWMHEHRNRLRAPLLVSVGAAFNILSGRCRQAPRWMREHGLEWLFRLLQEPRRLWRRYLIYGAQFIAYVVLDGLRRKKFEADGESGRPFPGSITGTADR